MVSLRFNFCVNGNHVSYKSQEASDSRHGLSWRQLAWAHHTRCGGNGCTQIARKNTKKMRTMSRMERFWMNARMVNKVMKTSAQGRLVSLALAWLEPSHSTWCPIHVGVLQLSVAGRFEQPLRSMGLAKNIPCCDVFWSVGDLHMKLCFHSNGHRA